jgi:hypothetical protein
MSGGEQHWVDDLLMDDASSDGEEDPVKQPASRAWPGAAAQEVMRFWNSTYGMLGTSLAFELKDLRKCIRACARVLASSMPGRWVCSLSCPLPSICLQACLWCQVVKQGIGSMRALGQTQQS